MEPESSDESASNESFTDGSVSFARVNSVVTKWTLDFMFLSLCRRFKEGKLDDFNETLSTVEAIYQSSSLKREPQDEKMMICAFLARVMHGKQLDVLFEEDSSVMPLMSAAKIWSNLKGTVADKVLVNNINILLLVQSVAVCMEKGQMSSASSALKWFENNHEFPEKKNLRVKLTTIVTKRETYHPVLMSFSFSRLLETVQAYLDIYLEKNPSDYLLKAATKMVQSSQNMEDSEDVVTPDGSLSETANESTEDRKKQENTVSLRTKRKLLSTKMTDVWKPDTCKKTFVSVRRISKSELSQMTSKTSVDNQKKKKVQKTRKTPKKWTAQLDKYLKDGVKCHGQGKWSRILMDYDFEGRTGTMLKDRWRVLMKAHEVG